MKNKFTILYILMACSFCIGFSKPKKKDIVIFNFNHEYRFNISRDKEIPSRYTFVKAINDSTLKKSNCRFIARTTSSSGEDMLAVQFTFANEKNIKFGTMSDDDGKVDFMLPKSDYKLIVSYVGYTSLVIDTISLKDKSLVEMEIELENNPLDDIGGVRCKNSLSEQELQKVKEQMRKKIVPDKVKCGECMPFIEI